MLTTPTPRGRRTAMAGLLAAVAGLAPALLLPSLVSPSAAAEFASISGYTWLDADADANADGIRDEGEAPAVNARWSCFVAPTAGG